MAPFPQSQTQMLNAIDVFTGGLALLAFVMALYVLAAREQKTPYITNSVYSTALIVLTAILSSTLSKFLSTKIVELANIFYFLSLLLFGIGILSVFFWIRRAQNRRVNFRDDHLLKNLKPYRSIKGIFRRFGSRPTYAHDPIRFQKAFIQDIDQSLRGCSALPSVQLELAFERYEKIDYPLSFSGACRVSNLSQADNLLVGLALCFLRNDCWVQYTTCARHPTEFLFQLKKAWENSSKSVGKDWRQVASQIVGVDAYTPHFGFTDTIHDEFTKRLRTLGINCLIAKASYAGLHTAAARAFNAFKGMSEAKQTVRKPTLTIYEGTNALVELESTEQYRIFIRHLLPSERLWGGMFTFVIESVISEQDLALLRTYTDFFIDLSASPNVSICTSDEGASFKQKEEVPDNEGQE